MSRKDLQTVEAGHEKVAKGKGEISGLTEEAPKRGMKEESQPCGEAAHTARRLPNELKTRVLGTKEGGGCAVRQLLLYARGRACNRGVVLVSISSF